MLLSTNLSLGYKEGEFNWASYLKNGKAQAAPKTLFKALSTVSGNTDFDVFHVCCCSSPFFKSFVLESIVPFFRCLEQELYYEMGWGGEQTT